MSKFSTFRSLTSFEKKIFVQSILLLPALRIGLQFISYRRLIAFLQRTSNKGKPTGDEQRVTSDIEHMVRLAARYRMTGATCLTRSMTLWWLLRRQGVEGEIQFGVRRDGAEILAHAWIEIEGEVINDRPDIRQVFATFGSASAVEDLNWQ